MAPKRSALPRWLRVVVASMVAAVLVAVVPLEALAADLRQGSDVTVGPGETVNDDLYAGAGTISISGTVNGNAIAGGGTITVSGNVTGDLILGGGTINVTGRVGGSIIAAGGNLTLNGSVLKDVVVAGGTVDIPAGATIGRDLVVAGGTTTVSAPIARRVRMSSGSVTLRNKVGGDVTGRIDHLKLDGAQIGGNLDYTSDNQVELLNGARVAGTTTRHARGGRAGNAVVSWLQGLVGIFALGLLLILLLPALSTRAIDTERAQPWASLGIGAAICIVTPIVALIVFIVGIFIGGWWLGLLLIPIWILALAVGYVVSGFLLGRLIFAQLGWSQYHDALKLLGGLLVLSIVLIIPVLGWLVGLAALLFGTGALAIAVAGQARGKPAAA